MLLQVHVKILWLDLTSVKEGMAIMYLHTYFTSKYTYMDMVWTYFLSHFASEILSAYLVTRSPKQLPRINSNVRYATQCSNPVAKDMGWVKDTGEKKGFSAIV